MKNSTLLVLALAAVAGFVVYRYKTGGSLPWRTAPASTPLPPAPPAVTAGEDLTPSAWADAARALSTTTLPPLGTEITPSEGASKTVAPLPYAA
jgi:hypothetical protein